MTRKLSLIGELHANERPCLKNAKRWVAVEVVLWLQYAHAPATTHAQKHLCTQSPENACVFLVLIEDSGVKHSIDSISSL